MQRREEQAAAACDALWSDNPRPSRPSAAFLGTPAGFAGRDADFSPQRYRVGDPVVSLVDPLRRGVVDVRLNLQLQRAGQLLHRADRPRRQADKRRHADKRRDDAGNGREAMLLQGNPNYPPTPAPAAKVTSTPRASGVRGEGVGRGLHGPCGGQGRGERLLLPSTVQRPFSVSQAQTGDSGPRRRPQGDATLHATSHTALHPGIGGQGPSRPHVLQCYASLGPRALSVGHGSRWEGGEEEEEEDEAFALARLLTGVGQLDAEDQTPHYNANHDSGRQMLAPYPYPHASGPLGDRQAHATWQTHSGDHDEPPQTVQQDEAVPSQGPAERPSPSPARSQPPRPLSPPPSQLPRPSLPSPLSPTPAPVYPSSPSPPRSRPPSSPHPATPHRRPPGFIPPPPLGPPPAKRPNSPVYQFMPRRASSPAAGMPLHRPSPAVRSHPLSLIRRDANTTRRKHRI